MTATLSFQLRADSRSVDEDDEVTVRLEWFRGSDTWMLGDFTSLPAGSLPSAPWQTFEVDLSEQYAKNYPNRLEITKIAGASNAKLRDVRVQLTEADDLGQFPRGFPYTEDVEDGMVAGSPILNDGGELPESAYYAEQGDDVEPSLYNYEIDWTAQTPGTHVQDYDNWVNHGGIWEIAGGAVQSGYENPPQGDPLFSMLGHDCFPVTRADGFYGAPHHNIELPVIGSARGMSNIGPIWGWNSWDDFFFCWIGGHADTGVYRVQGGVPTLLGVVGGGNGVTVEHDFITGDLHVDAFDAFFLTHQYYDGNHPHTVGYGRTGWMSDRQNAGIFGDSTWCLGFSLLFSPGLIGHKRQFSMETGLVVDQTPLTWWFGGERRPPLRHRQRDDQRARSIRNQPRSKQASDRQGWRNTYL